MKKHELITDENLKSMDEYGPTDFPIAYYNVNLSEYIGKSVNWHWHKELEFAIITEGIIEYNINGERLTLVKDDCIFFNSEVIHSFTTQETGTAEIILFLPEFIAPIHSKIYTNCVEPVLLSSCEYIKIDTSKKDGKELFHQISKLLSLLSTPSKETELLLYSGTIDLWKHFILMYADSLSPKSTSSAKKETIRLQKMMKYIQIHFSEELSLDMISTAANISKSEALRCFKTGIQTTPVKYLNEYRLGKAQALLLSSSDSITEIALSVGYDNAGYFCKAYKLHYGISPNKFRKQQTRKPLPFVLP